MPNMIENLIEEPKSLLEEIRSISSEAIKFSPNVNLPILDKWIMHIENDLRHQASLNRISFFVRIAYASITSYVNPDIKIIDDLISHYKNLGFRVHNYGVLRFFDVHWD